MDPRRYCVHRSFVHGSGLAADPMPADGAWLFGHSEARSLQTQLPSAEAYVVWPAAITGRHRHNDGQIRDGVEVAVAGEHHGRPGAGLLATNSGIELDPNHRSVRRTVALITSRPPPMIRSCQKKLP